MRFCSKMPPKKEKSAKKNASYAVPRKNESPINRKKTLQKASKDQTGKWVGGSTRKETSSKQTPFL